jgi:hypothetical protein
MSSQIKSSLSPPTTLTTLPGELRNAIFTLCIEHALSYPKSLAPLPLTATIYSPSPDTGHIKLSNIGPLPLLFLNKQTFTEISFLLYAQVEHISLGPGISQYLDDDPEERWKCAYSLVERQPYLQRMAKTIEITLPRTPNFSCLKTYASLIKQPSPQPVKNNALAALPGLQNFLGKFNALECVTIAMIAELKDQPPNYREFEGLWGLFGEKLKLEYKIRQMEKQPYVRIALNRDWMPWKVGWVSYVRELEEKGKGKV